MANKELDEDFIQRVQSELDGIITGGGECKVFVECTREEYERLLHLASLAVYSGAASHG